ncbi:MAG: ATP-binding protein [Gammaproteobacteria bacterium]|nr:ATP-binding protein [Gammaproteobacteria bacterium]
MHNINLKNGPSTSRAVAHRLPSQTRRVVHSARRMQWALVVVAVANIAALVLALHLNRLIVSHYTPMLDGVLHVKQSVISSHLWHREYRPNADLHQVDEIVWHLQQAQTIVENVIAGRQVHLLPLSGRPDSDMLPQWSLLLDKIRGLQAHAAATSSTAQQPQRSRAYDEAVRDVVSFADLLEARLETRIGGHLAWLQRLQVAIIGFFVLLVAVGAFLLRRSFQQLLQEIQRRCRAERRLERSRTKAIAARDELAEAIAAKDQFLGKVSHEVRTQTNSIFGLATMIESTNLDDAQHSYVRMLESEANTLLRVMEDMLELSKLRSHRLAINPSSFELHRVVADAVDLYVAEADAKGVELDVDIPVVFPEALIGDPARIHQVLVNLLKNAIKFTDEGEVLAKLRCVRVEGNRCDIEIRVRDTGVGIPADKREHVFDPFAQADASTTHQYGGTGLGLAICRDLVVLMGGEIGFENVAGDGTEFLVSLPLPLAEGAAAAPPAPRLDGLRLLLTDRDDNLRERTCRLLSDCGATADTADSGYQAMDDLLEASAKHQVYDAVIVSDRLGDVGLEQFISRLRADERLKAMRVVAIRRSSVFVNAVDTIKDDLTIQLGSPYRMLDLPSLLLRGPAAAPAAKPRTGQDVTLHSRVKVLLVDDHPVMQIAGRHLLEGIGCHVDSAHDGSSALRLWENKQYDVMFLDGEMPDIDGLDVARRIRKQEGETDRPHCHIVGIAANTVRCSRERCLEAGMDDYIGKPVSKESFVRAMRRFAASRESKANGAAADSGAADAQSMATPADAAQQNAGPLVSR